MGKNIAGNAAGRSENNKDERIGGGGTKESIGKLHGIDSQMLTDIITIFKIDIIKNNTFSCR